jgi:hypothetical protein
MKRERKMKKRLKSSRFMFTAAVLLAVTFSTACGGTSGTWYNTYPVSFSDRTSDRTYKELEYYYDTVVFSGKNFTLTQHYINGINGEGRGQVNIYRQPDKKESLYKRTVNTTEIGYDPMYSWEFDLEFIKATTKGKYSINKDKDKIEFTFSDGYKQSYDFEDHGSVIYICGEKFSREKPKE